MIDFIQHPIVKAILGILAIPAVWKIGTWIATNAIEDAVEETVDGVCEEAAESATPANDTSSFGIPRPRAVP